MVDVRGKENYLWDVVLLVLALAAPSISMYIDVTDSFYPDEVNWLSRSGSLVVLFAVMLEFRQQTLTVSPQVTDAFGKPAFLAGKEMNGPRKTFHIIALLLSVIGTLIWGYGDVPNILLASH